MTARQKPPASLSRREALAALLVGGSLPTLLRAAQANTDVPWLAEVERPPAGLPPGGPQLSPLLVDDDGRPITTLNGWQRRRQSLRRWWLDFLQMLPVDRQHVPSLTVLEEDLAAFDDRLRAAVSSEGGIGTRFSNWDAPWYLGPDARRADLGHEHHELLALAAPRPLLFLAGESGYAADGDRSWPFLEAAMPVYKLYGGRPRLGLFNHRQGHSVPPEAERRIYEWLAAYL